MQRQTFHVAAMWRRSCNNINIILPRRLAQTDTNCSPPLCFHPWHTDSVCVLSSQVI